MTRRYSITICMLILPLFLTGCWDYKDVNRRTIGVTMGLDELNGEDEYAGEKAKIWGGSSGIGGMVQITETYKYDAAGQDLEKARTAYDVKVPAIDFPGATRVVVFSKSYAQKKGLGFYMNRLYSILALRSSVMVVISKEKLDDFFSKRIDNDICIGYGIEDTVGYLHENGMAIRKTVQEIQSDIRFGNIGYLLPYVTEEENTVKYLGFAAMKDSKLVAIIKREESSGFLFLLSKKAGSIMVITSPSDDKNLISIQSKLAKRSIKTSYVDKKINIYINLKLKSQLQYEYKVQALSRKDMKIIEKTVANNIKENILSAIKRSQNEFKCDVFGFARYFKGDNLEVYKSMNWKEEYEKVNFYVNVDTTIVNTNLLDTNVKRQ